MIQWLVDWLEQRTCDHEWAFVTKMNVRDEYSLNGPPIKIYQVYRCTHCLLTRKVHL